MDYTFLLITSLTWHTDAAECSSFIEAGSIIFAGVWLAFVDVHLATRSGEADGAVAAECARSVNTDAAMLTRIHIARALVNVLRAVEACPSVLARALVSTINWACVTDGSGVTRIREAGIIDMAQQSHLARRTDAIEAAYAVHACRSVVATGTSTLVIVF